MTNEDGGAARGRKAAESTRAVVLAWERAMVGRGLSPRTIHKRLNILRRLIGACGDPFALEPDQIVRWLDTIRQKPDSRYGMLSNLHAFYVWAIRTDRTNRDPTERIDRPRLTSRLPRPMPERDFQLAAAFVTNPLLRAWVLLGGMTGLRCVELGRMEWADVDLEQASLFVRGKGNHERIVPLHPVVVAQLADLPRTGPYLNGERPSSGQAVSTRLARALHDLGITATPHQLRHRAATECYRATGDLLAVKRLLGHASIATTQIYTQLVDEDLRAAAFAVPPPDIHPGRQMPLWNDDPDRR